jgi:hypothetical protein
MTKLKRLSIENVRRVSKVEGPTSLSERELAGARAGSQSSLGGPGMACGHYEYPECA